MAHFDHAATLSPRGVGAVGSAMARFFHPGKPIRDKWPHDEKRRLTGVLVTGETTRRIGKKEQSCYVVRIMEIDDSTQFFIVKKNFKVEQAPTTPFESEAPQPPLPPVQAPAVSDAERSSVRNVVSNIKGRIHVEMTEDIADPDIRGSRSTMTMSRRPRACRRRVKPFLFPVMADGTSRPFAAAAPTTSKTSQGNFRITVGTRSRTTMSWNSSGCASPKNGSWKFASL